MKKHFLLTLLFILIVASFVSCADSSKTIEEEIVSVPTFSQAYNATKAINKNYSETYDFYLDWINPLITGFVKKTYSNDLSSVLSLCGNVHTIEIKRISKGKYKFTLGSPTEDVFIETTVDETNKSYSYLQAMRVHCDKTMGGDPTAWDYDTIVWGNNLKINDKTLQVKIDCIFIDPAESFGSSLNYCKAQFFNSKTIRVVCFYDYLQMDSTQTSFTNTSLAENFTTLRTTCEQFRKDNLNYIIDNSVLMFPIYYIMPNMDNVMQDDHMYTTWDQIIAYIKGKSEYAGWDFTN